MQRFKELIFSKRIIKKKSNKDNILEFSTPRTYLYFLYAMKCLKTVHFESFFYYSKCLFSKDSDILQLQSLIHINALKRIIYFLKYWEIFLNSWEFTWRSCPSCRVQNIKMPWIKTRRQCRNQKGKSPKPKQRPLFYLK